MEAFAKYLVPLTTSSFDAQKCIRSSRMLIVSELFAGSLESAYSLNWGAREIWGKGEGETLALLL